MSQHLGKIWERGVWNPRPVCCAEMAKAFIEGTDNEMYGRLAHCMMDDPRAIHFGADLEPLKFCPWCGFRLVELNWKS